MVFAILSYEFVIAFTLGLQLVNYNSSKKVFILSLVYGLTCPIGIAIGTIIYETGGGCFVWNLLSIFWWSVHPLHFPTDPGD